MNLPFWFARLRSQGRVACVFATTSLTVQVVNIIDHIALGSYTYTGHLERLPQTAHASMRLACTTK